MSSKVHWLFAKFTVRCAGEIATTLDALESFPCLLLNRPHPHNRDRIATLLCNDIPGAAVWQFQNRTFWQLQSALALSHVYYRPPPLNANPQ